MPIRYVDRSRSLSFQSCPRKRFWNYEAYGQGVQPIRMSIPLVVGQCVHAGLAVLLYHHIEADQRIELLPDMWADRAVATALEEYDTEVRARGFVLSELEDASEVYEEQKALIEGMIRVWALRRLPSFLEQFEVLEVEREDQFKLTEFDDRIGKDCAEDLCYADHTQEIIWMSRADGLLRERATGDLYVLSFKTASEWNDFKDKEARIDMQGMSELYAIEQRLKEQIVVEEIEIGVDPPKLSGVQMEFLLKGRRSKDKETGVYAQDSMLVRPYFKDGGGILPDEWAWKYWTHCEGPHRTAGGKNCAGDANHSLGKGWYRVPVWKKMPMKEWIQMLHEGEIQSDAGDALEGLIVSPMPFFRHEEEIQDWVEQMQSQEEVVAANSKRALEVIEKDNPAMARMTLNGLFPQHRESCFKYGEKHSCSYLDICFGNIGDPLESGLYQLRTPHHSPEQEQFEKETSNA